MFSLRFSGSKFLINSRWQFRVREFFSYTSFCGIGSLFILCLKFLFRKCVTYVLGCSRLFSLRFSGSKFLINSRWQFRVREFFSYTSFCGIGSLFILCLKFLFRKCVTYVLGCSFIKFCSLTHFSTVSHFYTH